MKHPIQTILTLTLALLFCGCNEGFRTWRELNDDWIAQKQNTLGTTDPDIKRTQILPSGVMIEVYHDGFGPIPKPSVDPVTDLSSSITVNYRGYLVDGTKFNDGTAITMYLSNTIPGWQQALSQMRQGSSWRIYIPYAEGYGDEGSQDSRQNFTVPPYSTLIFDIDLLDVVNY